MPDYEHHERHTTLINASHADVWRAIREVQPREIRLLVLLTAIRGLGQRPRSDARKPLLDVARAGGFTDIGETGDELVLGTIGQFWRMRPRECQKPIASAASFKAFAEPGFAKSAINFLTRPENGRIRLMTETRIATTDPAARRRFTIYWSVIYAGSALIRREWLRAIKRRAESPGSPKA
jgi:hypothetical protein